MTPMGNDPAFVGEPWPEGDAMREIFEYDSIALNFFRDIVSADPGVDRHEVHRVRAVVRLEIGNGDDVISDWSSGGFDFDILVQAFVDGPMFVVAPYQEPFT